MSSIICNPHQNFSKLFFLEKTNEPTNLNFKIVIEIYFMEAQNNFYDSFFNFVNP